MATRKEFQNQALRPSLCRRANARQLWNSLRRPIYVINWVDNIKLPNPWINELYFTCTHSNSFLIVLIPGYLTLIHSKVHHLASAAFSHVKTIHEFMNAFISSHATTIHSFTQSLSHFIHSFFHHCFFHSFFCQLSFSSTEWPNLEFFMWCSNVDSTRTLLNSSWHLFIVFNYE